MVDSSHTNKARIKPYKKYIDCNNIQLRVKQSANNSLKAAVDYLKAVTDNHLKLSFVAGRSRPNCDIQVFQRMACKTESCRSTFKLNRRPRLAEGCRLERPVCIHPRG